MHTAQKHDNVGIITVDPALSQGDRDELDALTQLCAELQGQGCLHIALDMAGLEHAPSLVLGSIIVLRQRLKAHDGELAILRPTERMKRILGITSMDKVVRIYADEGEALRALARD